MGSERVRVSFRSDGGFIDRTVGSYVALNDWLRRIQVVGIIRSRKPFLRPQECYIQVTHCIDIDESDFIDDIDEYVVGVEDDLVCKIRDMTFYSGEQNYRDLNVNWAKAIDKAGSSA